MRIYVAMLAVFPILAAAQDFGPYHITSGDFSAGGYFAQLSGTASGNGFTAGIAGGPEFLSYPGVLPTDSLSFCLGCGLLGTDDGSGNLYVTGLNNPALVGLVQVFSRGTGSNLETGEFTVSPIDITGTGTYTALFTMSADLAFGPSHNAAPTEYADFVGHGTVTLDVGPPDCPYGPGGPCGPPRAVSIDYHFAPELDPASLSGALTLLCGGLLVLRGRRPASANVRCEILAT
jgi:hypothetical protein